MEFDPEKTVRFKRSIGKTALLLSLCVPFVVLGYVLTTGAFDAEGSEGDGRILGILCIAFFGGIGLVGGYRLLRNPDQAIEFGPDGILDPRISENPIPWTSIERISTWSSRGSSMIMLELDKDYEARLNPSVFYKAYQVANRLVGAKGHCLNPMGFGVSFARFKATLFAYAAAHGAPAAGSD